MAQVQKLRGYALVVKRLQDDMVKEYESGNKDGALYEALAKKRLTIVEKFSGIDRDITRDLQILLYYKSKLSDMAIKLSINGQDDMNEFTKMFTKMGGVINEVKNTVSEFKESQLYQNYLKLLSEERKEREKKQEKRNNNNKNREEESESDTKTEEVKEKEVNLTAEQEQGVEKGVINL